MALSVIILAAGQGKRMNSSLPKVLQQLGGRSLLEHVVSAAGELGGSSIYVVYGHGGEQLPQALSQLGVSWVKQPEQLGTGHAVMQAMPQIPDDDVVLVLYGDVPLIRPESLDALVASALEGCLAILTARVEDAEGYGRIIRNSEGEVQKIVEHKDAGEKERRIREINTGLMACAGNRLRSWLGKLGNNNSQNEYYLTDIIAMAVADGIPVAGILAVDADEVAGVNDRVQLAHAENVLRHRRAEKLMLSGVTLRDPARIDIRGELTCGRDVVIDVNAVFEGKVSLGDHVTVGPHCVIRNSAIGNGSEIFSHTTIDGAVIDEAVKVGPFARIRPEAHLSDRVHIGNFVEVKKSEIGADSKANHLSYIGDSTVGERVNIGAGTITCNYDGVNKHRTVIEDEVFVGSDTQFVAPVRIGAGATVGAGSTITRDVSPGKLVISRARQTEIDNWKRPEKKK